MIIITVINDDSSYSGDFEIYGMDGTGENDDDETPLVPADTPR